MKNTTIKRGEVYLCDLGSPKGSVQGGVRPVLVIQNNVGNERSGTIIVAPITSATKPDIPTHIEIDLDRKSTVLCEQVITVPKKSIRGKVIYKINNKEHRALNKALGVSLGLQEVNYVNKR